MSRIDELITELCPERVEFCELNMVTRRTTNIKWSDANGKEYLYIDLTSVDRATHAIVETQTINAENTPSRAQQIVQEGDVIFGTTRPLLKRYTLIPPEYDGQICSTGYCVLRPNSERVLPNFVFHLLGTESFYAYVEANERGASYPAITDSAVRAFRIPIPPLEIQHEIVKVLDTFTQLEARRRQYQYYRDALLCFGADATGDGLAPGSVRWATLGEITTSIASGRNKTRSSEGAIPVYGSTGLLGFTDKAAYSGDVLLVARVGANAGLINAVSGDYVVSDNTLVFRPVEAWNIRFAFHQLTQMNLNQNAVGGGQPLVTGGLLKSLKVPIPALQEQERIAAILDQFDALVNDLSSGLPAEIKARRQQYEYYRDRLLSFKEAA